MEKILFFKKLYRRFHKLKTSVPSDKITLLIGNTITSDKNTITCNLALLLHGKTFLSCVTIDASMQTGVRIY